jgi:hypothetical protein
MRESVADADLADHSGKNRDIGMLTRTKQREPEPQVTTHGVAGYRFPLINLCGSREPRFSAAC